MNQGGGRWILPDNNIITLILLIERDHGILRYYHHLLSAAISLLFLVGKGKGERVPLHFTHTTIIYFSRFK